MAVCGAGCMGFVNVTYGLRAVGYVEPDPLPAGPVALITHSGSVFSALLRTRRALGFTVAVSSGQELVTTAAQYAEYALSLPETRVLALVLEAIREPGRSARCWPPPASGGSRWSCSPPGARRAAVPWCRPTPARWPPPTAAGRRWLPPTACTGSPTWPRWPTPWNCSPSPGATSLRPAPLRPAGTPPRGPTPRPTPRGPAPCGRSPHSPHPHQSHHTIQTTDPASPAFRTGIATVHDSGLERAHVADVADELGVPFAAISPETTARLAALLDPGLEPANPLDVWGTGSRAGEQLSGSLAALAGDPAVRAVALAVDLVHEFDGDQSYPLAVTETARRTSKPVVVLSNVPAAIDTGTAAALRASGIPVLEGTRTGLLALKHLLDHAADPDPPAAPPGPDQARQQRWTRAITAGEAHGARLEELLRDYGMGAARTRAADSVAGALAAAAEIGYPVVLKTGEPGIAHKSDAGGVLLGLRDPDALGAAYQDLAERLGRRVLVCETIPAGPELSLGLARTTSWARCWWWGRVGCWWNCSPTAPSRCPRSVRPGRAGCWPRSGCPGCSPGCAASPPPTWTRSPPRSPASPSSPPNSATCWRHWTSTR